MRLQFLTYIQNEHAEKLDVESCLEAEKPPIWRANIARTLLKIDVSVWLSFMFIFSLIHVMAVRFIFRVLHLI